MRKTITIAVVAFLAGSASTWTLTNSGANTRNQLAGAPQHSVNTLDLTMNAGVMPSQQFDAH
jgi:hypothetical protein